MTVSSSTNKLIHEGGSIWSVEGSGEEDNDGKGGSGISLAKEQGRLKTVIW